MNYNADLPILHPAAGSRPLMMSQKTRKKHLKNLNKAQKKVSVLECV